MPLTVNHVHVATSPDVTNGSFDILPQRDWNDTHAVTLSLAGSEGFPAFTNAGNVTFGLNSAGYISGAVAAAILSAGTALASSGTLSLANSNGVSFGISGNTLTASVSVAPPLPLAVSAGNNSVASGTVVFSNQNGVTFGMDGQGVVTATVNPGPAAGMGGVIAGSQTQTIGSLSFVNANGIQFGLNGSSNLTASYTVPVQTVQTQNAVDLSISGNVAGGAALISSGTAIIVGGNNVTISQNGQSLVLNAAGAGASAIAGIAGSNGTVVSGTVNFQNGNGASFFTVGPNNIGLSYTVPPAQTGISGISAAGGSVTSGTLSLANSNSVSFGMAGSTLTASIPAYTSHDLTLAGNTAGVLALVSSGTLTFAGGNNITLSQAGNAITISGPNVLGAQTGVSGISAGTTQATSGTVSFANSNGVTFGMNGQTMTASVASTAPGMSAGISTQGNTLGNTGIVTGQLLLVGGANITLSGSTNAGSMSLTISGGAGGGGGGAALSAGTQSTNGGTVVFSNSNGVSFGMSNSSVVTASVGNQTLSLYALGNTTQNSSTTLAGAHSFNGLGEVTIGFSNGSIQISAPPSSIGVSGGNTSNSSGIFSGPVAFAGGNNITLSVVTGAGGAQSITISGANAGGAQTGISSIIVSNTTYTAGAVSFSNANGVSFGSSAGSAITASFSQSAQSMGIYASSNTTGASSSSTVDARSLSIEFLGAISGGMSAGTLQISAPGTVALTQFSGGFSTQGNTGGNTALVTGQLCLVGSNNITLSGSTNGGSLSLSIIGGGGGTLSLYATGNTTQNSSTTLANSLTVNGIGAMTVGYSNGSLQLSAPQTSSLVGTNGISVSVNGSTLSISNIGFNVSAGTTSQNLTNVVFSNSNGVSFGLNGSTVTASAAGGGGGAAISAGTQSTNGNTVVFSNSNGISFGMSNSSVITASYTVPTQSNQTVGLYGVGNTTQNSSTTLDARTLSFDGLGAMTVGFSNGSVQLSAPAISSLSGVGNLTISTAGSTISISVAPQLSFFRALDGADVTTLSQIGNGSLQLYPCNAPFPFSASRADVLASISASSSSNSSYAGAISLNIGLYTLSGSTLSLASSASQSYAFSNTSNNSMASISGLRRLSVPLNVNYVGGDLWVGVMSATASTNTNWFTASNVLVQPQMTGQLLGLLGQASNNTYQLALGSGLWSTTSAALPASVAFTAISGIGSSTVGPNVYMAPVYFGNVTA
jgi:hypothetical protein